ncbi:MAG: NUDIX domain-containing protein [Chloroflexota bacterium]
MGPPDERVLGVPRRQAVGDAPWRGILYGDVAPLVARLEAQATFRPRAEAEEDPSWKQLIPYVLVRDRGAFFLMRRTRAGGDARLHERWSLGVGGHVNPGDVGLDGALRREWTEELDAPWDPAPRLIGLLNDESDPVGRVHLGIVYAVEVGGRPVAVRESEKLSGAFVAPLGVLRVYDRLETWSSLLYDFLTERRPGTRV